MPTWEDLKERDKEICRGLGIAYFDADADNRDYWKERKEEERMLQAEKEDEEERFSFCDVVIQSVLELDFEAYIYRTYYLLEKQRKHKEQIDELTEKEIDDLPF